MATYFQAVKADKVFREYRRLTLAYWEAQPPDNRGWMGRDLPIPENEQSLAIRREIINLYPIASTCARRMGVPVNGQSFPPPMIGGPVINVNVLYGAFDRAQGYGNMEKQTILDGIDRCLAQSVQLREHLFWRQLVNPVWWVVEIIAYLLRIPFMILRRAGVPAKVEESIWGHIVKVGVFIVIVLLGLHYGLKLNAKDILSWTK